MCVPRATGHVKSTCQELSGLFSKIHDAPGFIAGGPELVPMAGCIAVCASVNSSE